MAGRIVGPLAVLLGVLVVIYRQSVCRFFDDLNPWGTGRGQRTPAWTLIVVGVFLIVWGVFVAVTGDDLVRGN